MSEAGAVPPARGRSPLSAEARARRRQRLAYEAMASKRRRDLVTPEGAVLRLKIASFGERAGAFLIDFILQWLVILLLVLAIGYTMSQFGMDGFAIGMAMIAVSIFVLRNFYFIYFEMGRRAATPGKRLLGLRVAARNGGQLKANAVFARNFMREIEVGLPFQFLLMGADGVNGLIALFGFLWAGVFMFFPLFNRDKLRVGDLVAGTWVIHAPRTKLAADIATAAGAGPVSAAFAFTPAQVDAYGIHELHVLEDVLRQGADPVQSDVASRIRRKIGWTAQPGEQDRDFLDAYYAALRQRLEQRMLLGDRKQDKYDVR